MPDITDVKQVKVFIVMNKILSVITLVLLTTAGCKDASLNTNQDFFTPVQVYLNINLSLPTYAPLTLPQGFVYEPGGNKGIIIYRTIYNEYIAFDRTCPNNPTDACSFVSMDSTMAFFRCGQYNPNWKACCNSKFDPATGTPIEGAARRPLKQYFVRQDGNVLIVTNIQ